jgi:hypothetical protein
VVQTLKVSNDPHFDEKFCDVIGFPEAVHTVTAWLAKHQRFHLHFTQFVVDEPVERLFG